MQGERVINLSQLVHVVFFEAEEALEVGRDAARAREAMDHVAAFVFAHQQRVPHLKGNETLLPMFTNVIV